MRATVDVSLWLHIAAELQLRGDTPFLYVDSKRYTPHSEAAYIEVPAAHYLMLACNDAKAA